MKTEKKPSSAGKQWFRITIGMLMLVVLVLFNVSSAFANVIEFNGGEFFEVDQDKVLIGNTANGANNTTIQFGDDSTGSENGNITWDIINNEFDFDHDINVAGGIEANGNVNFSSSTQFHIREVADEATATCTVIDELVVDTAENTIYICTAVGVPGTWSNTASAFATDLQGAYDADASGAHEVLLSAGGSEAVEIRANANDDSLLQLQNSTAASIFELKDLGGTTIDINSLAVDWDASGNFALDSTGTVSIDGVGASNVSTDSGVLTLSTTTSGDIAITSADDTSITSGADITFDDNQLTAPIKLTNIDTGFDSAYGGEVGIIDVINQFASVATGEGASNIGIEDAGSYFTGVNTESVLQEIGAKIGSNAANTEVLTFYPGYPDAVFSEDGGNNRGRVDSEHDSTENTNYYSFSTRQLTLQDVDLIREFELPADFLNVNDLTLRYSTGTATAADNAIDVKIINVTDGDTVCASSTTNNSVAWATITLTKVAIETGCTGATVLDAGDIVQVQVKFLSKKNVGTEFARIGVMSLGYNN